MRLDIGAGHNPYRPYDESWLHTDIKPLPHIEFVIDSRHLRDEIEPESVDVIRTAHHLEHFEWHEIPQLLTDWLEMLKPSGYLEIIAPNCDTLLPTWLEMVENNIFEGHEFHRVMERIMANAKDEYDKHRVMLHMNYLKWVLNKVGFRKVEQLPSEDLHVRAWKCAPTAVTIRNDQWDNRRVSEIAGKRFFIVANRGWGDILASTCAIHELKARGAAHIAFGSRLHEDFSLIRQNSDVDYLFNWPFDEHQTANGDFEIEDDLARVLYADADYRIDHTKYRDEDLTFYESRCADVGVEREDGKLKPHIELAGHIIPDMENVWFPKFGLKPYGYVVLHHQSAHISRAWHRSEVDTFVRRCQRAEIPLVVVGESSPIEADGVVNWTHQVAFDSGAGMMKLAKCAVCTDSVFSHIAHAFDVPQVTLYSDAPYTSRIYPHSYKITPLQGERGQREGIKDISAETVFEHIKKLWHIQ